VNASSIFCMQFTARLAHAAICNESNAILKPSLLPLSKPTTSPSPADELIKYQ